MFEQIVLRRAEDGRAVSAGQVAQALLYYQHVQLFIDRGTLIELVGQLGADRLIALLRRSDVSAVYCEELLAVFTTPTGVDALPLHKFTGLSITGHKSIGELNSLEGRIEYDLTQAAKKKIDRKTARRFAKTFLQLVPVRKLSGNHFLKGGIEEAAMADILDKEYLHRAMRCALSLAEGGYDAGDALKLEIVSTEKGFYVIHNIDLAKINQRRASMLPPVENFSLAHLLSRIHDARADLALAAHYGGDFITSAATSSIIQIRHHELLRRAGLNADSQRQFEEIVLPDTPRLAEVIDAGEQSFDDFLRLLDRAERFKRWLGSVNPDEGLVRTYMRDINAEGWIQRLPAKTTRYLLAFAVEAVNPIAAMVAGFADNFLAEKLLSGWRPSHFVESRLNPFVKGK